MLTDTDQNRVSDTRERLHRALDSLEKGFKQVATHEQTETFLEAKQVILASFELQAKRYIHMRELLTEHQKAEDNLLAELETEVGSLKKTPPLKKKTRG